MVRNYSFFTIFPLFYNILSFFLSFPSFSEKKKKNESLYPLDYLTKSNWAEVYAGDKMCDMLAKMQSNQIGTFCDISSSHQMLL